MELAHGPGGKLPGIHDGQLQYGGVRCLALRQNATELVSAGGDGQVIVWDLGSGRGLGPIMKTIQVGPGSG